jgi:hypothetical protein
VTRRRQFLATTGLCLLAGCSSGGSPNTPRPGPGERNTYDEPVFAKRGEFLLPDGEHQAFSFGDDSRMELSYWMRVVDGVAIDAIVFAQSDYETYSEGGSITYNPNETVFETAGTEREGFLDPGDHVLVFDNTDASTESVGSDVTVEYGIEVTTYE